MGHPQVDPAASAALSGMWQAVGSGPVKEQAQTGYARRWAPAIAHKVYGGGSDYPHDLAPIGTASKSAATSETSSVQNSQDALVRTSST